MSPSLPKRAEHKNNIQHLKPFNYYNKLSFVDLNGRDKYIEKDIAGDGWR